MKLDTNVLVVGAGPYGLSIATHAQSLGIEFRILGQPMQSWIDSMPKGMSLKSEGFASTLHDPTESFSLADYCAKEGISHAATGFPISLETFVSYGLAFQQRLVPEVDRRSVEKISRTNNGFIVRLDDGDELTARNIVVSIGLSGAAYTPPALQALPTNVVSHSSHLTPLRNFVGKDVAIIGAGASALDIAVLLHRAGAHPVVISRSSSIVFQERMPNTRSFRARVRAPMSSIGPGWPHRFYTSMPMAFHALPTKVRHRLVRSTLGPSGGWSIKEEARANVPFLLNRTVTSACMWNGRVKICFSSPDQGEEELEVDHVIAATGYRPDVTRLSILSDALRSEINCENKSPVLSRNFESSIPGLYFVGVLAANSFGPMLRFICGAQFAARQVTRHLKRTLPTS